MLKPLPIAALVAAAFTPQLAQAGTVTTDGEDLVIKTKGGIEVKTADGDASFKIGGRLQWDYDKTESSDNDKDTSDFDVRRARLYASGHYGDWAYKAQFNIAESDGADGGDAEDLYIRYTGFGKPFNITLGKQKEPFGLENNTSSKDISLLERGALTEFYAPGKNAGVQLHGKGGNWTYGIGVFEAEGDGSDDFDNLGYTGRVTWAPIQNDDLLLHLGGGYTTRDAEESDDEFDAFNLELAGNFGPLHAQAEYFDGDNGQSYDGYYVQAGWIITGGSRPYKDGKFKRVKPAGKYGAWEVALRWEDGDGKYSDIGLASDQIDGEQWAVGVNWYVTDLVRLGMAYMDGEADDAEGNTFEGEEFRARVQFAF